ncbi:MAG TPA: hypothetical protein VGF59_29305, partial [Bryobacteraceae bacterium]
MPGDFRERVEGDMTGPLASAVEQARRIFHQRAAVEAEVHVFRVDRDVTDAVAQPSGGAVAQGHGAVG